MSIPREADHSLRKRSTIAIARLSMSITGQQSGSGSGCPFFEITQSRRLKLSDTFRVGRADETADRNDRDRDRLPRGRADKIDSRQCRSCATVVGSSIARTTVLGTFSAATRREYLSCRSHLLASKGRKETEGHGATSRRERKVGLAC